MGFGVNFQKPFFPFCVSFTIQCFLTWSLHLCWTVQVLRGSQRGDPPRCDVPLSSFPNMGKKHPLHYVLVPRGLQGLLGSRQTSLPAEGRAEGIWILLNHLWQLQFLYVERTCKEYLTISMWGGEMLVGSAGMVHSSHKGREPMSKCLERSELGSSSTLGSVPSIGQPKWRGRAG